MQAIVNKADICELFQKDAVFIMIDKQYGNPPRWTRAEGFESLCQIILEQQVSLASAKAHFNKLKAYIREFSPEEILKLSDIEMRNCQISRQKAVYLRSLSNAVRTKNLELDRLNALSEEEIREALTEIKGIGKWTSDIYLMFCLQRKDIFPSGDIAVIRAINELYSVKTKDEAIELSSRWKPLRSLASYYFWHFYLSRRNRI
ncbi:MAG: DNA-3-methyladenine glycosylase 2 family protein [Spirochaetia bacterium]|jgi:DNA-3-methyladenine glycosylase II|nr:DNA-3-methyladenine glycosylase 2 family protein [Spirochaetia bacterium]